MYDESPASVGDSFLCGQAAQRADGLSSISSGNTNRLPEGLKMNSEQCRVARAMMGWTIKQLSREVRVAQRTIANFENESLVRPEIRSRILSVFVTNGIEFIYDDDGVGVKRRLNLDEYVSRFTERTTQPPLA